MRAHGQGRARRAPGAGDGVVCLTTRAGVQQQRVGYWRLADQRDRCRVLEPTGIAACAALALGAWGVSRADALPGAGLDAAMLAMVLGLAVGNWRALQPAVSPGGGARDVRPADRAAAQLSGLAGSPDQLPVSRGPAAGRTST